MTSRATSGLAFLSLMILASIGPSPALGQAGDRPKAARDDDRREDRAAIRAAMQSFVKAFEAGNAKDVAGHWTAEGEYEGEAVGTIRGRDALEAAYTAFFAKNPKVRAETRPESLRFVCATARWRRVPSRSTRGRPRPTAARYSAFLVREDGRWRFARLSESAGEGASLDELSWLVGEWKSSGQDAEVTTTYSWNDRKTFVKVRFTIKDKDRTLDGDQFLGRDPATGQVRAWTFESGGGIGEGTWSRDGDRWVVEATGTITDGNVLTTTNILTKVDNDTFTWQSIHRVLGDDELPDLAPVKVMLLVVRQS